MSAERHYVAALVTPLFALGVAALFPADAQALAALGEAVVAADWTQVADVTREGLQPMTQSARDVVLSLGCALHAAGESARCLWAAVI